MEILRRCSELLESGKNLVLVTIVKTSGGTPGKEGFKLVVTESEDLYGTVGGGAVEHRAVAESREVLEARSNRLVTYNLEDLGMKCGGQISLLYEYMQARRSFVLFGVGHIGRALAPILDSLGFQVTLFDSRSETKQSLAENLQGRLVIGDYKDISPVVEPLKRSEFVFIATHGHEHDYEVLKQTLESGGEFRYIGLIGSRHKIRTTLEKLEADGLEAPDCFYGPVGLDIGGDTAAEIAVSIAAEVVAVQNGSEARHMRATLKAGKT